MPSMPMSPADSVHLAEKVLCGCVKLPRECVGGAREEDADLLLSVANQIEGRTICAFGEAAAWPTQSFIKKFRDHFEDKAKSERKKDPPYN